MREITVSVPGKRYPILIGRGLLDQLGEQVRAAGVKGSVALVQDSEVAGRYGTRVLASLEAAGIGATPIVVPAGEESKSLDQLARLYREFSAAQLDRGSAVVALGGGVVGDLSGFAAASYLRGIGFIQVPTTLLAQVDASVGGKTGIDLESGKNLVGAFHQPELVLIDLEVLDSLPERAYRAGLAEVLKYGVIFDRPFFDYLTEHRTAILARDAHSLAEIIARSCEIKAEVVGQDERESGIRAILNYGHTIGHAVEAVAGYSRYLHGEAVSIGMAAANWLSQQIGWLSPEEAAQITALQAAYGLPVSLAERLEPNAVLQAMLHDKKTRSGELRFVLARQIGKVEVAPVPAELALEALEQVQPEREK